MGRQVGTRMAAHWVVILVIAALLLGSFAAGADDDEPPADPTARREPAPLACTKGPVALTFDDGPSDANSKELAKILAEHNVPATFFMIGRSVRARPGRTRVFALPQNRIYNHTYDHPNLTHLSNEGIRKQIKAAHRAFKAAGVRTGRLVRPPFGAIDKRVRRTLRKMGYRTVLWTIDPRDWSGSATSTEIATFVTKRLRRRANILLHDTEDTQATLRALPRIIQTARKRGYCFGVVNERGRVVKPDRR